MENKNKYIPNLVSLCYLIDEDNQNILLGKKKYGGAMGKYNGFGGKVEYSDTSIKAAVIREFKEETNVNIEDPQLNCILKINKLDPTSHNKESITFIYIYLAHKWTGEPKESYEMSVEWIDINKIHYDQMWENDKYWLPFAIGNRKCEIDIASFFDKPINRMRVNFKKKLNEGTQIDINH